MVCLLVGTILAVAMVSAVPLYTDGILQRMLQKDLEQFQLDKNIYPGKYVARVNIHPSYSKGEGQAISTYQFFDKRLKKAFADEIGVDRVASSVTMTLPLKVNDVGDTEDKTNRFMDITGVTDLREHTKLIAGRWPEPQPVDGVYECLIIAHAQDACNILLDREYVATDMTAAVKEPMRFKAVGILEIKDDQDPWWYKRFSSYKNAFFIDYSTYQHEFLEKYSAIGAVKWYHGFDYHTIKVDMLPHIIQTIEKQEKWMKQYSGASLYYSALDILKEYAQREKQLVTTLWVLQVPILLMLCFYIFMVSQLVVENEKNEIAVFKSRGSSTFQIFGIYSLQSAAMAMVAVIVGPLIAIGVCQILGASNGFMELVSRSRLPLIFRPRVIGYAIVASIFAMVMMLIPVMFSSRITIVEHKKKKARRWQAPLWKKAFLDVIFIALSLYGLYNYKLRQETIMVTTAQGLDVPVDPFLFAISTLFVLGAGLLFLRIYPYIIRGIYWLGRKIWSPVMYTSFVHVGRSSGKEQFLMLFLILTLSIGIFSANSARTINQNMEDRVRYRIGADMTFETLWPNNSVEVIRTDAYGIPLESAYDDAALIYREPPFSVMEGIKGVEKACKVLKPDRVRFKTPNGYRKGVLMAVEPAAFAEVASVSPKLLPHHINEYMNILTQHPYTVVASTALRDEFGFAEGDAISYTWANQSVDGIICAFVDYWPSIDPTYSDQQYFVISNYSYVHTQTAVEPYEVWVKRADDVTTKQMYDDIEEKGITMLWVDDARQEIIKQKNDPLLQGTNGAMTMGFVVTMGISMIGFIIYWILSVKSRALQFGIFRAMGMTRWHVIGMIAVEQVMISLVAIIMGIIIGGIACDLYVPMLQMVYSASEQIPPFRVVASRQDYYKIYSFVIIMLTGGLGLLGYIISKVKVDQAIKLGED